VKREGVAEPLDSLSNPRGSWLFGNLTVEERGAGG
jgi:hypothetical protein